MNRRTDSSDGFSDVCTHFSTDETVCDVSISGLQCLERNKLFARVETAWLSVKNLVLAASLERCQLRQVRLDRFFNSLPSACFRFPSEFFEPELNFGSDTGSACSCFVDQPRKILGMNAVTVMRIWGQLHVNFGI